MSIHSTTTPPILRPRGAGAPEAEPWYYSYTQVFAWLLALLGVAATLMIFAGELLARSQAPAEMQPRLTALALGVLLLGLLASFVVPALLLIFVDIGRTLRQIRRQR